MLILISCSIKVDESVLNQMSGNVYHNSGGFSGESIRLNKDSTFSAEWWTCTMQGNQFVGNWKIKSDTLILNSNKVVNPEITNIKTILEKNNFKNLRFRIYDDGIRLLYADEIELGYQFQYFYDLSKH